MPTTPKFGIRYPAGNITPNAPLDMQKIAEDTEAVLAGVKIDATPASGWVSTLVLTRVGGLVVAAGKIVPAANAPAGTGVLAAGSTPIGTIPSAAHRPTTQLRMRCFLTQSTQAFEVIVNPSGSIEARIVTGVPTTLTSASIWGLDGVAYAGALSL